MTWINVIFLQGNLMNEEFARSCDMNLFYLRITNKVN